MNIEQLKGILQSKYPEMDVMAIRHDDLVYEERVRLKCLHCKNYATKWTCPGRLPDLNFRKIIGEYEHLAVIASKEGNRLHQAMLYLEKELFIRNEPMAVSFIGGSCELCKDGCDKDACLHPEQARVPWDATGCNVTRTLANIGVQIDFTGDVICCYGLFVW